MIKLLPFLCICSLSAMYLNLNKSKTMRVKIDVVNDYCSVVDVTVDKRNRKNDNILLEIRKNSSPVQILNIEIPPHTEDDIK